MYSLVASTRSDLTGISNCHRQCFKNSLSTKLGLPYVERTFDWFLNSPNRFLFHVVKNNEIVGYCGGFIPQFIGDGSTSGIMQYSMRQAITGVIMHPWLLFNKEVREMYPLIFKNMRKKLQGKKGTSNTKPIETFDKRVGLVVVGVHPGHRGLGVFQMLMQEFELRAKAQNINRLVLSVKKNNITAIKAYTKQGWFVTNEHANTLEMGKYLN